MSIITISKDDQCKRFSLINDIIQSKKVEHFMHTGMEMKLIVESKNGGVKYPVKVIEENTLIILVKL